MWRRFALVISMAMTFWLVAASAGAATASAQSPADVPWSQVPDDLKQAIKVQAEQQGTPYGLTYGENCPTDDHRGQLCARVLTVAASTARVCIGLFRSECSFFDFTKVTDETWTAVRQPLPGHPLRIRFGPTPATEQSFAFPEVGDLPSVTFGDLRRLLPRSAPALAGYTAIEGDARIGPQGAERNEAQVSYRGPGDRLFVLHSWSKTGEFLMAVPANSPVTDVQQTYVDGLAVLSLMPTPAVAGGIGPRTAWITDGSTIWRIDFQYGYTDNEDAFSVVVALARKLTEPLPPPTGTGPVLETTEEFLPIKWLGALTVVAGSIALAGQGRRRLIRGAFDRF